MFLSRWVPPPGLVMDELLFPSARGKVPSVAASYGAVNCGTGRGVVPVVVSLDTEAVQGYIFPPLGRRLL